MTGRPERHIVLVGMMGAGKSTVGRVIAGQLRRPLYDSDDMIEERTGRTVREIWAADGEPAYRVMETDVLLEALDADEPSVIAAAGGVVLSADNRTALATSDALVVWLLADIDLLVKRVTSGEHRPLLDDDPAAMMRKLYHDRAALYQEVADVIISVDHRSVYDVAKAVLRCFE